MCNCIMLMFLLLLRKYFKPVLSNNTETLCYSLFKAELLSHSDENTRKYKRDV